MFWTVTALCRCSWSSRAARRSPAGRFGEALLVDRLVHSCCRAILEGAINPSLTSVVEHIRKGTLDFVLLKPADAQFLVSTAQFQPWRATNVLTAAVDLRLRVPPASGAAASLAGLAAALLLLLASTLLLYSLWILTVSAAFYVVQVDNLTHLFSSIFDAARWPSSVFRGDARLRASPSSSRSR